MDKKLSIHIDLKPDLCPRYRTLLRVSKDILYVAE
jgi:hypothetical protein